MIAGVNIQPETYYKVKRDDKHYLILAYEDDFRHYTIFFNKDNRTYDCKFSHWVELSDRDRLSTEPTIDDNYDIPLGAKRSSYNGVWRRAQYDINVELHEFIDNKLKELGWK